MSQKVEFIYLSQEDVIKAGGLDMKGTLEAVETSFRLHASGDTILPKKPVLRWGGPETEETLGRIMAMPAFLGGDLQISGIKWIPSKPSNPVQKQPAARQCRHHPERIQHPDADCDHGRHHHQRHAHRGSLRRGRQIPGSPWCRSSGHGWRRRSDAHPTDGHERSTAQSQTGLCF